MSCLLKRRISPFHACCDPLLCCADVFCMCIWKLKQRKTKALSAYGTLFAFSDLLTFMLSMGKVPKRVPGTQLDISTFTLVLVALWKDVPFILGIGYRKRPLNNLQVISSLPYFYGSLHGSSVPFQNNFPSPLSSLTSHFVEMSGPSPQNFAKWFSCCDMNSPGYHLHFLIPGCL